MANEPNLDDLPQASVVRKKRMRFSIVWIIPILAAVVAIGIAIQRVLSEGPAITIVFKAAQGIEAGKTFIKYKDVNIGQVTAVQLSDDYAKVLVKAKIAKHAAGLMVKDAKFWVVEPRISLSGVSGLNTLLSGNYIGFEAGKSDEDERDFIGLDLPPPITDQRGRKFLLKASTLGSLGVGAPVYYRQISVGEVAAYNLAPDGNSVEITLFIDYPYDKYVTTETRFWNASGINVTVGADGVDVHTESLAALLAGGLAFDVPDQLLSGQPAAANSVFTLYRNRAVAMKQPDPNARRFALYFDEPVRGLSVGAPVMLYGLPVGEVASVGMSVDPKTKAFRPRALITFFPEQLMAQLSQREKATGRALEEAGPEARVRNVRHQVEDLGLRAQLQTGSYLTGELYVSFTYVPSAPKVKLDFSKDPLELPVVPGGLANIEAKLTSILTKIDNMPLEKMGGDVKNILASLNQTLKTTDALI
ncbi:MAG TPA: MlaD family protein, partial [Pseudomonadota bacterium]|nr:MlaD family protein [Pseudomonadota bacterium]